MEDRPDPECGNLPRDPALPLDIEWQESFSVGGALIRPLRFTGSNWRGVPQRVYAIFSCPEGSGPFPAVLVIPGYTQTCAPENAAFFAQRGYACLSFDWASIDGCHPPEKTTRWPDPVRENLFGSANDPDFHDALISHAVCAASRGLTVLTQIAEVDATRLGVLGISWGGIVTWILNGIDTRVTTAIPAFGIGGIREHTSGFGRRFRALPAALQDEWDRRFDPAAYASTQHGAVLFINGTNDYFAPLPVAERALAVARFELRRSYGPNLMHHLHPRAAPTVMAWLDRMSGRKNAFPEEPRLAWKVGRGGVPVACVTTGASGGRSVRAVHVDYSRGVADPVVASWLTAETRPRWGRGRVAAIPIVDAGSPLHAMARVVYEDDVVVTGAVSSIVPARDLKGARASLVPGDIISDWDNGPSGWYIFTGTEIFQAEEKRTHRLRATHLQGRKALGYEGVNVPDIPIHIGTRLLADPARHKGGRRSLELWTHDLAYISVRTNEFLRGTGSYLRPEGESSHETALQPGPGWHRSLIRPEDFSIPLATWDEVSELSFVLFMVPAGRPGIGLLRWSVT